MEKGSIFRTILMGLIFLTGVAILLDKGCKKIEVPVDYNRLISEIQSLKDSINSRQTIIDQSHDTLIVRTNNVKTLITEYRTVYDTITKIQICDSLVIECDKLQKECLTNDSLHLIQGRDMLETIDKQDTVINKQEVDITDLRRKNRLLKIGSAGLGAVIVTLLIAR